MSTTKIAQCAVTLEQDDVVLKPITTVNHADFLAAASSDCRTPIKHSCLQTVKEVYGSQTDLKDSTRKKIQS